MSPWTGRIARPIIIWAETSDHAMLLQFIKFVNYVPQCFTEVSWSVLTPGCTILIFGLFAIGGLVSPGVRRCAMRAQGLLDASHRFFELGSLPLGPYHSLAFVILPGE